MLDSFGFFYTCLPDSPTASGASGGTTCPHGNPYIAPNLSEIAVEGFAARAGIVDAAQITALEVLVAAAIAHGWWDKCDLIYPFVGGTDEAHAQNLKSDSFAITWFGAVTHDANGITGNGTTGYGNTGYAPSSGPLWSLNSAHLGIYRRTTGGTNRYYAGINTTGPSLQKPPTNPETAIVGGINGANISAVFTGTSLGFLVLARNDAINTHVFSAAADISAVAGSVAVSTASLVVLALNAGAIGGHNSANLAGLTAGAGLTFAEYTDMAADWQTFNTSLGRQV